MWTPNGSCRMGLLPTLRTVPFSGSDQSSRRTTAEWAPHSPDLNPCDFYLWGYLKAVSYRGKPVDLEELKQAVEETVRGIPMATCKAVIANFAKRVERCLAVNGTHFEHMPF